MKKVVGYGKMSILSRMLGFLPVLRRDITTMDDVAKTYTPYSHEDLLLKRFFEQEISPARTDGSRIAIVNQAVESPEIQSIIRNTALGLFGSGLTFQFIHKDKELTKKVERGFKEWQKKENCDLRGMHSFPDMLDLASAELLRAGGIIFRHHYSPSFKFGYKIEIIPVANIAYTKHDPQKNLFNGQQLDKNGARSGIWFQNTDNENPVFVNADELAIFIPSWVDAKQLTPIPMLKPVALQLESIDKYRNSEISMSIKAATRPFFWFTSLFANVLNRPNTALQANQSANDKSSSSLEKMRAIANSKLTSEQLLALPETDKVQQVETDRAPILDSLREESGEAIAGATSIPVSFLRNSAKGNNFASLKALAQLFEKFCEKDFGKYEEHIIRPIIEDRLFKMFALIGVPISIINNVEEWEIIFMPKTGRIDISPQDTMKQNVAGLEAGIVTINSIAMRSGKTGEELMGEVADERARQEWLLQEKRKEYGLPDPIEEQKKQEAQQQEQAKEESKTKTEAANNVNAMFAQFAAKIEAI